MFTLLATKRRMLLYPLRENESMNNHINRWLTDAFRAATIAKDYPLEDEVLFILQEKQKIYVEKHIYLNHAGVGV